MRLLILLILLTSCTHTIHTDFFSKCEDICAFRALANLQEVGINAVTKKICCKCDGGRVFYLGDK